MCRLLDISQSYKQLAIGFVKLLKTLFELNLRDPLNSTDVSFMSSLRESWTSALAKLNEKFKGDELVDLHGECMDLIYQKIYCS